MVQRIVAPTQVAQAQPAKRESNGKPNPDAADRAAKKLEATEQLIARVTDLLDDLDRGMAHSASGGTVTEEDVGAAQDLVTAAKVDGSPLFPRAPSSAGNRVASTYLASEQAFSDALDAQMPMPVRRILDRTKTLIQGPEGLLAKLGELASEAEPSPAKATSVIKDLKGQFAATHDEVVDLVSHQVHDWLGQALEAPDKPSSIDIGA
jgi:hypothetical protein